RPHAAARPRRARCESQRGEDRNPGDGDSRMNEKPRIAVIGAGAFGKNHVRVVSESPRAQLTHVVDPNLKRAREQAEAHHAAAASSVEEIIGQVDAAIVAAPTSEHANIGCRLLEAGIDVLVEKPIAATVAEADRLVETAE